MSLTSVSSSRRASETALGERLGSSDPALNGLSTSLATSESSQENLLLEPFTPLDVPHPDPHLATRICFRP